MDINIVDRVSETRIDDTILIVHIRVHVTNVKSLSTLVLPYSCPRVITASEDDLPHITGIDAVGLSKTDRGELAGRHVKDHRGRVAQGQVHVHIC